MRITCCTAVLAAMVANCGDPEIVVPDLMTVVSVLPSHGSVDVGTDVQGLVYFSHPVEDAAALGDALRLECLGAPPCTAPNASGCGTDPSTTVVYDPAGQVARVTPASALQTDTCYVVVIEAGIASSREDIGPLPVEVRSSFKTR